MSVVWSAKIDAVLCNGIFLDSIGVKNWALPKSEALRVLNQFLELQVPILGGDVCELSDGALQYNYDNWFTNKVIGESDLEFVDRSIHRAKNYIEDYQRGKDIFFTLVPGVI